MTRGLGLTLPIAAIAVVAVAAITLFLTVTYDRENEAAVYVVGHGLTKLEMISDPDREGNEIYHRASAVIWKNGVGAALNDSSKRRNLKFMPGVIFRSPPFGSVAFFGGGPSVYSVYVSGGDVYAAGAAGSQSILRATVWKNGAPQTLSDGVSCVNSIHIYNGDVYVAGYVGDENSGKAAGGIFNDGNQRAAL